MSSSGSLELQGIQGIQGLKGDPGGITYGTAIGAADWNTLTTDGVYRGVNSLGLNSPGKADTGYGVLVVTSSEGPGTRTIHTWYPATSTTAGRYIVQRVYAGAAWTVWRTIASSRVDQTAGRAIYQWDDLNNREQLVYGDTGWRDVTAELANGAVANTFQIRRTLYTVHVRIDNLTLPTTAVGDTVYTVPAGFISGYNTHAIFREDAVSGAFFDFNATSALGIFMRGPIQATPANNTTHRYGGAMSWSTSAVWPATLPGTAFGTIPNA